MLLVDFPWYDAPFLKSTHDRLWSELRSRLQGRVVDLPERRHSDIRHDDLLESDQLLLTQTCGFYLATDTPRFLNIVGTPVFDLPECPPGFYFSYFVSAKTTLDGKLRLAVNDLRYGPDATLFCIFVTMKISRSILAEALLPAATTPALRK